MQNAQAQHALTQTKKILRKKIYKYYFLIYIFILHFFYLFFIFFLIYIYIQPNLNHITTIKHHFYFCYFKIKIISLDCLFIFFSSSSST